MLALIENFVVEVKLLLIQFVDSFHVFHTLFQDLHFRLESNLLLGLLIGVLTHHVFELLGVLRLLLLPLLKVLGFNGFVFIEEDLDFFFVASENALSLLVELSLDILQLLVVVLAHLTELTLHADDESVDII